MKKSLSRMNSIFLYLGFLPFSPWLQHLPLEASNKTDPEIKRLAHCSYQRCIYKTKIYISSTYILTVREYLYNDQDHLSVTP